MSGPYNNGGYPNQSQYPPPGYGGGAPPAPQYGAPQYGSPDPNQQQQSQYGSPYPPQGSPYQQQQGGYQAPPAPQYGGGYGPPENGGFQHGQTHPNQYGPPSPQPGYQQPYPGNAPNQQFPQQGAYNQQPYPGNNNAPYEQGPVDPNAPPGADGDRGLLGALGGGAAGYYGGKKMGNHGIIGALVGAFAGSKAEDYTKGKHKASQYGQGKW